MPVYTKNDVAAKKMLQIARNIMWKIKKEKRCMHSCIVLNYNERKRVIDRERERGGGQYIGNEKRECGAGSLASITSIMTVAEVTPQPNRNLSQNT